MDYHYRDKLSTSFHKLYSKNFDLYTICVWNIRSKEIDLNSYVEINKLKTLFSKFGPIVEVKRIDSKRKGIKLKTSVRIQYAEPESALKAIKCGKINKLFINESFEQPLQNIPDFDENFLLDLLIDDCVLKVYSYLNFEDHVNLSKITNHQKILIKYYYQINKTFNEKNVDLNHTTLYAINNFFMENGQFIEHLILLKNNLHEDVHKFRLEIINFAAKYCPNIKTLKFDGHLPDSDFKLIIKIFVHLKTLDLSELNNFADLNIHDCLTLNNIETLALHGKVIFNKSLQRAYPNLRHLTIWNAEITGAIINQFPNYLQNLETLRIRLDNAASTEQFGSIIKNMPMLKKLGVALDTESSLKDCLTLLCSSNFIEILDILQINRFPCNNGLKLFINFVNLKKLKIGHFKCCMKSLEKNELFWNTLNCLLKCNLEYLNFHFNSGSKDFRLKLINFLKNNLQKYFTLICQSDGGGGVTIFYKNRIVKAKAHKIMFRYSAAMEYNNI